MVETMPPKFFRILLWAILICGVVGFILGVAQAIQKGLGGFSFAYAMAQPISILMTAMWMSMYLLWVWPRSVRQLRLRNAAKGFSLPGETVVVPLVEPQPIADDEALSLPITIRIQPRWRMHIPTYSGIFLVFIALVVVIWNSGDPVGPGLTFAVGGFGTILCAGIVAVFAVSSSSSLMVSEEGVSLRQSGFTQRVAWDQSRLFALIGGSQRNPAVLVYELGGTRNVVRWSHQLRRTWYALSEPELPFEVYDQQMRALLQLIAARTKLPLYDVR